MNQATFSSLSVENEGIFVPPTLKAHVLNKLRDAIVTGTYKPGDRLNESQLARDLNISRIPIREALMTLQEQGLVMNHERRGMFVTILSEQDVQLINSLRVVLEAEALKLCRLNMTPDSRARLTELVEQMEAWEQGSELAAAALDLAFHREMWRASGNPYLAKTLDSLATVLFAHKALENASVETRQWRLHHHRALLDVAIGKSDVTPEDAVIGHLRTGYDNPDCYASHTLEGRGVAAPFVVAIGPKSFDEKKPKKGKKE
ncbi:GntR family transcriptional regulator [Brevundimonas sp. SL161]|uniref:GntR family transcriptional regulator n=1 Tax=Brevundimonas sp. SL161 TaxID=2804613 RepID=UPI003CFA0CCB